MNIRVNLCVCWAGYQFISFIICTEETRFCSYRTQKIFEVACKMEVECFLEKKNDLKKSIQFLEETL